MVEGLFPAAENFASGQQNCDRSKDGCRHPESVKLLKKKFLAKISSVANFSLVFY